MKVIEGGLVAKNVRIMIVASRFNQVIVSDLIEGAVDTLQRHGLSKNHIDVLKVPGAFEIPLAAKAVLKSDRYHAAICLGAVIRGATPHFDYVAGQCAAGLQKVQLECGKPAVFGVLTTDTIDQAAERSGGKAGNKGSEAAMTAIEMIDLLRQIDA